MTFLRISWPNFMQISKFQISNFMVISQWVLFSAIFAQLRLVLGQTYNNNNTVCRHLARNPFICDCNLRWLSEYLQSHPIETSGARCESPRRMQRKKIGLVKNDKFRCKGTSLQLAWDYCHLIKELNCVCSSALCGKPVAKRHLAYGITHLPLDTIV